MLKKIWEATDTDGTWLAPYIIGSNLIAVGCFGAAIYIARKSLKEDKDD